MKLKRIPEDFQVEELTSAEADGARPVHALQPFQAGPRHARGRRGDLPAVEPVGPAGQLRRAEGPARRDDPVPDDRRRTASDRSTSRASTSSRSGSLPFPYGPQHFSGNRFRNRDPRPGPRVGGRGDDPARSHRAGRPAQLLRRPAVRLGGLLRPVHRPRLAEGRPRDSPQAGTRRGQPVRPLGRKGTEGDPPRLLGPMGRGQGQARAIVRPEHRDLPRRSSRGLPRRLRTDEAGAPLALLLGLPEPPLEPGAVGLDRAEHPARAADDGRPQGRHAGLSPGPRAGAEEHALGDRASRSPRRGRPSRKGRSGP